jgi:hypothetical protein
MTAVVLVRYGRMDYLTNADVRAFNALTIALPLAIALNLTASLRDYANLLRWRILASSYWPLDQFSLIMQCSAPPTAFKLVYKTRRSKYWFWPSMTQFLSVVWLLVNLGAAVLVSLLGLTFPTSPSTEYLTLQTGSAQILDLSSVIDDSGSVNGTIFSIQSFGVQGASGWDVEPSAGPALETYPRAIYHCEGCEGDYWYRFQDQNAAVANSNQIGAPTYVTFPIEQFTLSRHVKTTKSSAANGETNPQSRTRMILARQ